MRRSGILISLLVVAALSAEAQAADPRLRGVWSTRAYVIDGKEHPMDGLFIFTDRHFSANAFFRVSGGERDDANANAGTYRTDGNKLIFMQQVQIHIRPGDQTEPLLYGKGVEEAATYEIQGSRLVITFPSTNRYVCERVQ